MACIDFSTIEDVKFDERNFLKTGIEKLDREIIGLGLGHLVIITGPRAGGKTTLTSQLVNNFIDRGYQGLMCSFEMSNARLKNWILLQALGAENLKAYTTSGGKEIYFPKNKEVKESAERWIGNKLKIYDNGSFKKNDISLQISAEIKKNPKIQFVIIDNLMKIEFDGKSDSKWEEQSQIVKSLQIFAQRHNICIILVAHPNKVKTLPRIEDVGGSGDIINTADTVLMVHRVTKDFKQRAMDNFSWSADNPAFEFSNIIEIAKDREFGADDSLIGVYFDSKSKRFLNNPDEQIKYGWDTRIKEPIQSKIALPVTLTAVEYEDEDPF